VDRDLILRKLFSRSVTKAAPTWKIQEAANGETALRLVDEEPYDLIFMDQYMTSTEKLLLGTDTVRALVRAKGFKNPFLVRIVVWRECLTESCTATDGLFRATNMELKRR
jgi:CheY-like chemotaxis protein